MFLHLADSRHFGRSARAMHVSPSTLSRQIQRLEEDLGQPLFVRDNRTYQQLRHSIDQQGPSLSGELHIFCSVTAAYSHLPPILDRFRAAHPSVEIKLTTGDASDAMEKVVTGEADLAIAGKPETLPGAVAFSMLENLAVVLIAPALPCPQSVDLRHGQRPRGDGVDGGAGLRRGAAAGSSAGKQPRTGAQSRDDSGAQRREDAV
ncbi:hypothetical protein L1887_45357 [Cichorium endivia]|nr:hypothetical protein L1887_45357 [Cichorium endivia]